MARHTQRKIVKSPPTRATLLDLIDTTDRRLTAMLGRWSDGLPPEVRAELREIEAPLLAVLLRVGRR